MSPDNRLVAVACAGLLLNMLGFASVGAVLPQLAAALHLDAARIGWVGGAHFLAYAVAAPFCAGITDRVDARLVFLWGCLASGAGGLGFALFAEDLASALLFRALTGLGIAATYMPGLKIVADRSSAAAQARNAGWYASAYTIGTSLSVAAGGLALLAGDWRGAFVVAGLAPVTAAVLVATSVAPIRPATESGAALWRDLAAVLRDAASGRYALAAFGNAWEGMAFRTWWVAFLAFSVMMPDNAGFADWNLPLLSALGGLVAMPASLLVAEWSLRFDRVRAIRGVAASSVAVGLVIALLVDGGFPWMLSLTYLYIAVVFADSGALAAGMVALAPRARRGAALAAYALSGNVGAATGAMACGALIAAAGGPTESAAWRLTFIAMAAGSALVVVALPRAARA